MPATTVVNDFQDIPALDLSSKSSSSRFNLRKRSIQTEKADVKLSSYNSAFLSGLFADVAEVSKPVTPLEDCPDPRLDQSNSMKKSRISMPRSFSRCGHSYKNLTEVASPVGVDFFEDCATTTPKTTSFDDRSPSFSSSMSRINSLHFQLNCVTSNSPKSVKSVVDLIDMAFPHLPAIISDSSCSQQGLTQKPDRQLSDCETTPKECYGWFVDLDGADDDCEHTANAYASSTTDLTFSAHTAPMRESSCHAEVEWAKAADTVDDVLGDFF